jgi:hypothetical protein
MINRRKDRDTQGAAARSDDRKPTSTPPSPGPGDHGSSMSTHFVRQTSGEQPVHVAELVLKVLETWDRFSRLAPDPERSVQHLSALTGIPFGDIRHLREVRNLCAHPDEAGWPSPPDIEKASRTAGRLRRLLAGERDGTP